MKTSMTWTDDGGGRKQDMDMDHQVLRLSHGENKGSLLVKSRQSLTLLMPFIFVSFNGKKSGNSFNNICYVFGFNISADTIIRANFLRVLLAQTGSPAH